MGRLGFGHDSRRSFSTTYVDFYKWTQWIFLQTYNAWFDTAAGKARPIAEPISEFDSGARQLNDGRDWAKLSAGERTDVIDAHRLVYRADSVVNWCPGLGTVLANEEVTADGRSDRGNFPAIAAPIPRLAPVITAVGMPVSLRAARVYAALARGLFAAGLGSCRATYRLAGSQALQRRERLGQRLQVGLAELAEQRGQGGDPVSKRIAANG